MIWSYAWKSLSRRRSRTILVLVGIAAAIALFVGVTSISHAVRSSVSSALDAVGADLVVQNRVKPCPFAIVKRPKDLGPIDESVVTELAALPGVQQASGVLELWAFHKNHPTVVAGIDPTKPNIGPTKPSKGSDKCCVVKQGRMLSPRDQWNCLLIEDYAREKGIKLGDETYIGPHRFKVVGILDVAGARIGGAEAFIPLKTAQDMLNAIADEGRIVDTIYVRVQDEPAARRVTERARELIGKGASITSSTEVDAGTAALATVTRRTLLAISIAVVVVATLWLSKLSVASVAERVEEIGIMKATGWRDGEVAKLLSAEGLVSGLIGGVLGSLGGLAIAALYAGLAQPMLPSALASYPACSTTAPPSALPMAFDAPLPFLGLGIGVALVISATASFVASWRAARLLPAEALRRI
ncbi:MAG: ABC transporter permease [Armatimonadota bacterium]